MTVTWDDLESGSNKSSQNSFSLKEVGKIFLCLWLLYSKNNRQNYINYDNFLQLREQCIVASMPDTLEVLLEDIWYEIIIGELVRIGVVSRVDSSRDLYIHIDGLTASMLLDACEESFPEETKWMTEQIMKFLVSK